MKAKWMWTVGLLAASHAVAQQPALASQDVRHRPASWSTIADGSLVDVSIQVDGRTLPLYTAPGRHDRSYFEAFKGRNYALVIRNNTGQRVGVLIAVDGLNVVNGQLSGLSHGEPMYVLDPWETATIRGWRTSLETVRKFVFVDEQRSYAERTGQGNSDLGWIRVLGFRERHLAWRQPLLRSPEYRDGNRNERQESDQGGASEPESTPSRDGSEESRGQDMDKRSTPSGPYGSQRSNEAAPPSANPGTGWGDRRHDPVQRTVFEAERVATDHLVLRYEYASGLRALGIFPKPRPNRLWEREHQLGFAQPPRW
jgi:hypothetical protein